ncbi:MAG: hypothetical protein F6K47_00675 [Symploca sp. SIO2E6]|nr:hypothetical protein [Symploca sp. SIO2E6]
MTVQPAIPVLSATSILEGINPVTIEQLPTVWQKIARGEAEVGHPEPEFLVSLVRLFLTKATDGSPEIFQQGFDCQSLYQKEAWDTLQFFGADYLVSAYPNFELAKDTAVATDGVERVIAFTTDVFDEFKYELPASFYQMLLCPIERDSILESRPMAFDARMQGVKRAYDACLHAFNVTLMLMSVQDKAACHGLLLQHGCGCDHKLTDIHSAAPGSIVRYSFENRETRHKAITAYTWRMWNEYMLFPMSIQSKSLAL